MNFLTSITNKANLQKSLSFCDLAKIYTSSSIPHQKKKTLKHMIQIGTTVDWFTWGDNQFTIENVKLAMANIKNLIKTQNDRDLYDRLNTRACAIVTTND